MHPNYIVKEVCIFYGQIQGGILYIDKAKDGKLYIKLYDDHIVNTELLRKAAARQVKLPEDKVKALITNIVKNDTFNLYVDFINPDDDEMESLELKFKFYEFN